MSAVADGAQCTTAGGCTTKTSCCAKYTTTATATDSSTGMVCIPTGTAKAGAVKATTALANPTVASGSNAYAVAACTAASGSASLAVSAAAAATALYAMY